MQCTCALILKKQEHPKFEPSYVIGLHIQISDFVLEDINLADKTQNTINDYDISVVRSNEALWIYKEAFETVDSVNTKQIRHFLLKNSCPLRPSRDP